VHWLVYSHLSSSYFSSYSSHISSSAAANAAALLPPPLIRGEKGKGGLLNGFGFCPPRGGKEMIQIRDFYVPVYFIYV